MSPVTLQWNTPRPVAAAPNGRVLVLSPGRFTQLTGYCDGDGFLSTSNSTLTKRESGGVDAVSRCPSEPTNGMGLAGMTTRYTDRRYKFSDRYLRRCASPYPDASPYPAD